MKISIIVLTIIALAGCGSPAASRLQLEITSPSSRVETTDPELTVTGIISDSAAVVKVNGTATTVGSDGAFSHTLALPYGNTRIAIAAEKEGSTTANRTINVTRKLVLNVTSPEVNSESGDNQITVNGTISDQAARVFVTGRHIEVDADGTFSTIVPLFYDETVIKVSALLEGLEPLSTLLTVVRTD